MPSGYPETPKGTSAAMADADDDPSPFAPASVPGLVRRAVTTYFAHGMVDRAAALTYYAMLSLFPGLLVAVALLGLFGEASLATDAATYVAERGADPATVAVVKDSLDTLFSQPGSGVGLALGLSLVLGLNGASGAFGAAGRALNVINGVEEERGFVRRRAVGVGWTLVVITLLAMVLVALFLGGGIADDLFGRIGLGGTAAAVWSVARWPVALLGAAVAFAVVYAFAPDAPARRPRWVSPGATVAVVVWVVASLGFAVYVQGFSHYGAAYGAFGAAIVLLLWLFLTANAFLFGAELDATLDRAGAPGRAGPRMVTPPPAHDEP